MGAEAGDDLEQLTSDYPHPARQRYQRVDENVVRVASTYSVENLTLLRGSNRFVEHAASHEQDQLSHAPAGSVFGGVQIRRRTRALENVRSVTARPRTRRFSDQPRLSSRSRSGISGS